MREFEGRVTLVTGAGSGIGRVVARQFARSGAQVIVTDASREGAEETAEEIGRLGGTAVVRRMDVTSDREVTATVAELSASVGPVAFLVNCAGVSSMKPFLELTEEDWDMNMDVNAKGVFLVTREVVRSMVTRREGCVVSIASAAGKEGTTLLAHYSASKWAVIGLTQSVAREVARFGVRVNAVCPGCVRTPMQDREVVWEGRLRGMDPEAGAPELHRSHAARPPVRARGRGGRDHVPVLGEGALHDRAGHQRHRWDRAALTGVPPTRDRHLAARPRTARRPARRGCIRGPARAPSIASATCSRAARTSSSSKPRRGASSRRSAHSRGCAPSPAEPAGYDRAFWQRGAELGWTSLVVPPEAGGGSVSDQGVKDLALVAYQFGLHAAPGPLLGSNVVAAALGRWGSRAQRDGPLRATARRRGDGRLGVGGGAAGRRARAHCAARHRVGGPVPPRRGQVTRRGWRRRLLVPASPPAAGRD